MAKLSQEEQDVILRRMEEISSQIMNLSQLKDEVSVSDRARLCARLTRDWISAYRKLNGRA